ncbi:MAG: hypothetical protein GWP14_02250 [Actinobacteria bacterium]|nr:hypothetical protein [Actinomycetota bacterium]
MAAKRLKDEPNRAVGDYCQKRQHHQLGDQTHVTRDTTRGGPMRNITV